MGRSAFIPISNHFCCSCAGRVQNVSVFPLDRIIVRAGSIHERFANTQSVKPAHSSRPFGLSLCGDLPHPRHRERSAACPRSVVDGAICLYSVSWHFRCSCAGAGLAGSGNISVRDWDPPVRCLYGVNRLCSAKRCGNLQFIDMDKGIKADCHAPLL